METAGNTRRLINCSTRMMLHLSTARGLLDHERDRSGHCAVRQVMLNRPFRRLRIAQRTMMSNRQVGRDILERPSKERIRRGGGPDQLSQKPAHLGDVGREPEHLIAEPVSVSGVRVDVPF
jgi:hypothetical protein